MHGRVLVAIALTLSALPAFAQDVSVKHSVDRDTVGVGEQLTYTVEVALSGNAQVGEPAPPQLPGVQVVSSSASQNFQFVNGQMSASRVHQFILVPTKAGSYTIPPAKVDVNGQVRQASGEISFKVTPGSATPPQATSPDDEADDAQQPQQAPQQPDAQEPQQPPQAKPGTDQRLLFLRAKTSKRTVFQGEPLVYTSSLFSYYPFMQGTGISKDASFPGFVVESQQTDNRSKQVREGTTMYWKADVSRRVLVPTKSGTLTIQPETIQAALRKPRRRAPDPYDPFGGQFEDPFEQLFARPEVRHVTGAPIDVKVLPLPEEGKPADFSGAVGTDFFVTSALDKETLKENEVLTLRFTVKGRGDVRGVQEPKLEVGNDFKLFPAKATPKLEVTGEGLVGTKVFEIVLAPRGTGEKVIPGVKFSYFDTAQKKYVTKNTQAVKITVLPGEKEVQIPGAGQAPMQQEAVKKLGSDIQFIREDPSGLSSTSELVREPVFWASNVLPLALVLLVWAWSARRHRLESDVAWARRSRAYAAAKKQLGELRAGAGSLEPRPFYARLEQVLLEFAAGKLNRSAAGLVLEQMREALTAAAVEERLVKRFEALLERCGEMRYAPVSAGDAAAKARDLDEADQLLSELEGVLS